MQGKERVVSNSSPLIWLGKSSMLHLLKELYGEINIPEIVYEEISLGESADSLLVKDAVEVGWISVHRVDDERIHELIKVSGIHPGEAEAIILANELKGLLIVDDREASVTARVFGIRSIGTLGVLLYGLSKGLLNLKDFTEILNVMISQGFRLSIEVYQKAIAEARKLSK